MDFSKWEVPIEVTKPTKVWANVYACLVRNLREHCDDLPEVRGFANELATKLIEVGLISSGELQMLLRGELFPEDQGKLM